MKNILCCFILALSLISCDKAEKYDLVIHNVGLFDGWEDQGQVNVGIRDGKVSAITNENIKGDSLLDGTGRYLIPGMVDAHVHISSLEHLLSYYNRGVLTVLNMHTGLEDREVQWKQTSLDSMGLSVLYGAGHAATVPGGHPNQFSPDMETINDSVTIEDWVDHRIENGADYIKIVRDHHEWMGYPPLPTLSYEQIEQVIAYAHEKGLKAVVHANTVEEMMTIAAFGPDGFVHMPDFKEDYPIPDSYYEAIAQSGAFVVPTGAMALKPMDDAPPFVRQWVSENLLDADQRAEIIGSLHDHGVMIVAGTDAQEGQMNFGDDYFLELKLYEMAGLSNLDILKSATLNPAKAFGLPMGVLSVGRDANMVLLGGNPLDKLENLKKVEKVWKHGKKPPAKKSNLGI